MTVLKLTSFGGEMPRRPARHLPDGAALHYEDLLTTAEELRPLAQDVDVGAAISGAKTLYRLSRDANGDLRADPAGGWIATRDDLNFVKGQLNDDATERTVVADNAGVERVRVVDATGEDRLLGVPPPPDVGASAQVGEAFTTDDSEEWTAKTLMPALRNALLAASVETRYVSGALPLAGGTYEFGDANASKAGYRVWWMDKTFAAQLGMNKAPVDSQTTGQNVGIRLAAAPKWRKVDVAALEDAIMQIKRPGSDEPIFAQSTAGSLAAALAGIFDPDLPAIFGHRNSIDKAAIDMEALLASPPTEVDETGKPQPPQAPYGPAWYFDAP